MCEMCGPYIDDRPTLAELAAEKWADETCDGCGESRSACVCPPGCDCDPDEV